MHRVSVPQRHREANAVKDAVVSSSVPSGIGIAERGRVLMSVIYRGMKNCRDAAHHRNWDLTRLLDHHAESQGLVATRA
jgi:hypothetical protein